MKLSNEEKALFARFDHSMLSVAATDADIDKLCEEAENFGVYAVCVPPCYVSYARHRVSKHIKVCTVIAFPSGFADTKTKIFECKNAIKNGADELDVVINIGLVKMRKYDELTAELMAIRKACGKKVLKLILETPLLTHEEQVSVCTIATAAGVDYVKTCTGVGTVATESDVERLVRSVGNGVKVKAAGGVTTAAQAQRFIDLGADRIGESSILRNHFAVPVPDTQSEEDVQEHISADEIQVTEPEIEEQADETETDE